MGVNESDLTVAVTGPTGTFGFGLVPLLQADDRVSRVIGIARRPFDPLDHGWTKMDYRQGDVRDPGALRESFRGADVVVHLAFRIVGGKRELTRAINVAGTVNAFHAAAEAGVRRFVYASSVAAYGFHSDNPVGMTEHWPIRQADHLGYAQQKAELEGLLRVAADAHPELELYLLRPPIVLGKHAMGAKEVLPGPLGSLARRLGLRPGRLPIPIPVPVPELPMQFVHEDDVGTALLRCVLGAGPPGAYNIAGDGVVTTVDLARELGALPLPLPARAAQVAAKAVARLPMLPTVAEWIEAASHPAIMDTTRAKVELGWTPRFTGLEAVRATVR